MCARLSRLMLWLMLSLPSVGSVACGCPEGNIVMPSRNVTGDLRWRAGDATLSLDGHFSSSPSGDGISYDRATVPIGGEPGPALRTDLVLYAMSPGCHADATGARVCDRNLRVRLTVHGVALGAGSYGLDDTHANLELQVGNPTGAGQPCPDKPGLDGCTTNVTPEPAFVAYTAVSGSLVLSRLEEDCTDALRECALTAEGTFAISAATPAGDALELTSGIVGAQDTFMRRDPNTCD
jgi:hypothetical protein